MTLREGDVVAYTPAHRLRRDGYAIVHVEWRSGALEAKDTYSQNDTTLTAEELATANVLFNLDTFEETRHLNPERYHPDDVVTIPAMAGMDLRHFLRKGAEPLPNDMVRGRADVEWEGHLLAARAKMLTPLADQALAAGPLPELTAEEASALADVLRWVDQATKVFEVALSVLASKQASDPASVAAGHAVVNADEGHYELWRARRALDSKLLAIRGQ